VLPMSGNSEVLDFIVKNNQKIVDNIDLYDENTLTINMLEAIIMNIRKAADIIDCPYCATHMRLEAEELNKVLGYLKREGNTEHGHDVSERLKSILRSFKITFYIILGGLRRAGVLK